MLPADDQAFLDDRGFDSEVTVEGGVVCVVLRNFPLPAGYSHPTVDLLLRLAPGFPDVPPDMWWMTPAICGADGSQVPATSTDTHLGKMWQRWSRHFAAGQWQPGRDSLEGFLALIRADLTKYARPAA